MKKEKDQLLISDFITYKCVAQYATDKIMKWNTNSILLILKLCMPSKDFPETTERYR